MEGHFYRSLAQHYCQLALAVGEWSNDARVGDMSQIAAYADFCQPGDVDQVATGQLRGQDQLDVFVAALKFNSGRHTL